MTMTFEKGVPTSVNGEKMKVSDIIRTLNKLGGKHGIGIVDIVENRVVGMKSPWWSNEDSRRYHPDGGLHHAKLED